MAVIVWFLSLLAGACALGWILGMPWCDVGCVAALGLALLLGGEPRRAG